jgi:hypothetical protein
MKSNPQGDHDGSAEAAQERDHDGAQLARHLCGENVLRLTDKPRNILTRDLFGDDLAEVVLGYHRKTIQHGRDTFFGYPPGGRPTEHNPFVSDLLVIPVIPIVEEFLTDRGVEMIPTRAQVRAWAKADLADGGDGIDPELEYERAMWAGDHDLDAAANDGEVRICGVPQSIYDELEPVDQKRVADGRVIAPPVAPQAVAWWLLRNEFTVRQMVPGKRARAWMPTLIRKDQTWYHYASPAKGEPARWIARTDPEWMPAQLQSVLGRLWYIKIGRASGHNVYELKGWNPDTAKLRNVEAALAGLLAAGTGTGARELADAYGWRHNVYSGGTQVLCRNGVLDVTTGQLRENTPLWFHLAMIEADYDHSADPYAGCEWLTMLHTQWPDDPGAITCLQQWFGYVISGRTDLQKWMLIIGPSGSGKSIIAEVLGALTGAVTATKLDELNSRFGLQALYETGTALALMSDIRFGARDSSMRQVPTPAPLVYTMSPHGPSDEPTGQLSAGSAGLPAARDRPDLAGDRGRRRVRDTAWCPAGRAPTPGARATRVRRGSATGCCRWSAGRPSGAFREAGSGRAARRRLSDRVDIERDPRPHRRDRPAQRSSGAGALGGRRPDVHLGGRDSRARRGRTTGAEHRTTTPVARHGRRSDPGAGRGGRGGGRMTSSTETTIKAVMSVARDVAEGRLSPDELGRAAADECRELFGTVAGPDDDPAMWALQLDVARQVLAAGGIPADELTGEWAAVARARGRALRRRTAAEPGNGDAGVDVPPRPVSSLSEAHSPENTASGGRQTDAQHPNAVAGQHITDNGCQSEAEATGDERA